MKYTWMYKMEVIEPWEGTAQKICWIAEWLRASLEELLIYEDGYRMRW